jgi:hypothetical protein
MFSIGNSEDKILEVTVDSLRFSLMTRNHDKVSTSCLSVPDPDSGLRTRGSGSERKIRLVGTYFLKDANKITKTSSIFNKFYYVFQPL